MKALIIPPAWYVGEVTNPLELYLRQRSCITHTAQYRGHNGDDQKNLERATLSDYLSDTLKSLTALEKEGDKDDKPCLIGLSMGGMIAHQLACMWPELGKRFSGLMIYGAPGHGRRPYLSTIWKILRRKRYWLPIATRKGAVHLLPSDIEDLLFNGRHHMLTGNIVSQGESGAALFGMLGGQMEVKASIELPMAVTRCTREKFHHNSEAEKWAEAAGATYDEFEGTHFGALELEPFHRATFKFIRDCDAKLKSKPY